MLQVSIDGVRRSPLRKGERATCPDCGGTLHAVIPADFTPHWRHKGGDCDPWSEPEGPWHIGWKERFAEEAREVKLVDKETGDWHRADIRCDRPDGQAVVLELQHSPITEEVRLERDAFYGKNHRMMWLLHIHDEKSFRAYGLRMSLSDSNPVTHSGKTFYRMRWFGYSTRFIERWKRSDAHVFFDLDGRIYYLATMKACAELVSASAKGEFALCPLSIQDFVEAVSGWPYLPTSG